MPIFSTLERRNFYGKESTRAAIPLYDVGTRPMNFSEIAFLVLIALVLFGPRRLPEIAREMGKFLAEFKRYSNDFQSQIHQEINKLELEEAAKGVKDSVKEGVDLSEEHNSIASAISRLTERVKTTIPQDYDA